MESTELVKTNDKDVVEENILTLGDIKRSLSAKRLDLDRFQVCDVFEFSNNIFENP